jgi:SagB-type dehydrogenase family enzyme
LPEWLRSGHDLPGLGVTTARRTLIKYRRSPFLVAYWDSGRLHFYNYAVGREAIVPPSLCAVLDACSDWRSVDAIDRILAIGPARTREFLERLRSYALLDRSDTPSHPPARAMAAFEPWNPAAGFFHTATKRVRFLAPQQASRLEREHAARVPMPKVVKRLRGAAVTTLPAPRDDGEFPRVLKARRTWRRFSSASVAKADLATILGLSAGVQEWARGAIGELPLKTSPSGGARHPIECYVCVRHVAGIRPGLYHYAADAHVLEKIRGGDLTNRLKVWMPRSPHFARAAFVVLLTAVFERQLWRYPYARAYRAALAEAGHVCQTFCLTATWLGLAPFCLMGLADDEIERDLRIDGVSESVLYAAGAGVRPRGIAWAPLPRGSVKTRPNPIFRW